MHACMHGTSTRSVELPASRPREGARLLCVPACLPAWCHPLAVRPVVPHAGILPRPLQEQRSGRSGGLWVLKENAHRGKGVGVVSPPTALLRALERSPAGPSGSVRHVLAQRFVDNQLLINGRPFYIRCVYVCVGGGGPGGGSRWRQVHRLAQRKHLVATVSRMAGAQLPCTTGLAAGVTQVCPAEPSARLQLRSCTDRCQPATTAPRPLVQAVGGADGCRPRPCIPL